VGDCGGPLGVVDGVDANGGWLGDEDSLKGLRPGLAMAGGGGGEGLVAVVGSAGPADAGDAGCEVGWEGDGPV